MNAPEIPPACSTPPPQPRPLPASLPSDRQRAVIMGAPKWVNGTVLHYAFFGAEADPAWAPADDRQVQVVRESFEAWDALGLGLDFREVDDLREAEVRIGFDQTDGSWSYIGRAVLDRPLHERTMNFGWDLTTPYGRVTALHEIGHTLGMPHEHQNPFAGIVWNEEAVYASFAGSPNEWSREETLRNVLEKLDPTQVDGSAWDPASVMEYAFPEGLIVEPEAYRQGIPAPEGISELDAQWMRSWYPGGQPAPTVLEPFKSKQLRLASQGQVDFTISPPSSRSYEISTFGAAADAVAVLFERVDGELRYLAGEDDGGEDRNCRLRAKLLRGREYVLRVRLYWSGQAGEIAVMYW